MASFPSPFGKGGFRQRFGEDASRFAKLACLGFLGTGPQVRRMKKFLFVQWTCLIVFIFLWYKHNGAIFPQWETLKPAPTPDIDIVEYFKPENHDASLITWSHETRNEDELIKTFERDVMMFEIDVTLRGYGTAKQEMVPIIAQVEGEQFEFLFQDWLKMIVSSNKGFKVNFLCIEAVDISLQYLTDLKEKLSGPIQLSAAIFKGPNAEFGPWSPLDATRFIHLIQSSMPQTTLSLGWTDSPHGDDVMYTWPAVKLMYDTLQFSDISQPVNFNVHAQFVMRSIQPLKWLVDMTRGSLSIYSDYAKTISVADLIQIRKQFRKRRLYFIGEWSIMKEVYAAEASFVEEFPRGPLILNAHLWQVHSIRNMAMYISAESFLIKQGIMESVDDLYPSDIKSRVMNTTIEFVGDKKEEQDQDGLKLFSIYLHGLMEKSTLHGIRCSIDAHGLMEMVVDGVSPLHVQPLRSVLSGDAPCFRLSIVDTYNKQVRFRAERPKDCTFSTIEHTKEMLVPIVGMSLKSGRVFLSKMDDSTFVVVDQFQVS